eukprot:GHVS01021549.1.p1 GENE.GHVS01021549.1~~GHVS01021549.1.p1  ORF type:complete len:668 (-),score=-4.21 GHVS01021549.1:160-2163(-)
MSLADGGSVEALRIIYPYYVVLPQKRSMMTARTMTPLKIGIKEYIDYASVGVQEMARESGADEGVLEALQKKLATEFQNLTVKPRLCHMLENMPVLSRDESKKMRQYLSRRYESLRYQYAVISNESSGNTVWEYVVREDAPFMAVTPRTCIPWGIDVKIDAFRDASAVEPSALSFVKMRTINKNSIVQNACHKYNLRQPRRIEGSEWNRLLIDGCRFFVFRNKILEAQHENGCLVEFSRLPSQAPPVLQSIARSIGPRPTTEYLEAVDVDFFQGPWRGQKNEPAYCTAAGNSLKYLVARAMLGYASNDQSMVFLHGGTMSGKTSFLNTLGEAFPNMCNDITKDKHVLCLPDSVTVPGKFKHLEAFPSSRIGWLDEICEAPLNGGTIKTLTGGTQRVYKVFHKYSSDSPVPSSRKGQYGVDVANTRYVNGIVSEDGHTRRRHYCGLVNLLTNLWSRGICQNEEYAACYEVQYQMDQTTFRLTPCRDHVINLYKAPRTLRSALVQRLDAKDVEISGGFYGILLSLARSLNIPALHTMEYVLHNKEMRSHIQLKYALKRDVVTTGFQNILFGESIWSVLRGRWRIVGNSREERLLAAIQGEAVQIANAAKTTDTWKHLLVLDDDFIEEGTENKKQHKYSPRQQRISKTHTTFSGYLSRSPVCFCTIRKTV